MQRFPPTPCELGPSTLNSQLSTFPLMTPLLALDRWTWGFNDPTVMGWTLTGAYFLAAGAAGWAAWRAGSAGSPPERTAWGLLALALVMLGLNKQLDLQTLLQDWVKQVLEGQGWYPQRRVLLGAFTLGTVLALIGAAPPLLRRMSHNSWQLRHAWIGLCCLLVMILLRFLPFRPLSGFLEFTLLEQGAEEWHLHVVELFEFAFAVWIGGCALLQAWNRAR